MMMMSNSYMNEPGVVIIDYGAGNVFSVKNALQSIGVHSMVTDNHEWIRGAEKVIFPGVGAAGNAMFYLKERGLLEVIQGLTQPVLGICLGMQLLMEYSEEDEVNCLGIIPGLVRKISRKSGLRVPHMGWNRVSCMEDFPLFRGIAQAEWMYFVHSYYVSENPYSVGFTNYHESFASVVQKDNFTGVQFHPEKSAGAGLRLIQNFINLY